MNPHPVQQRPTCPPGMGRPPRSPTRQRGVALIVVLVLSAAIVMSALIVAYSARTELRIAHNHYIGLQALYSAEAGLNHVYRVLAANPAGFNAILASNGVGGDMANVGSGAVTLGGVNYRFRNFAGSGGDGYYVRLEDNFDETPNNPVQDADQQVRIISRGQAAEAVRQIEGLVGVAGPDCALITRNDLTISGNPVVTGKRGCVHSNSDTTISGGPDLAKGAWASGTLTIGGHVYESGVEVGVGSYAAEHSGQPAVYIPSVRPFQFGPAGVNLAQAVRTAGGIRLDADGNAYDSSTPWTCTENPPDCSGGAAVAVPAGWTASGNGGGSTPDQEWKVSGSAFTDGAYFVEGWVTIGGNPGNPSTGAATPWRTTIIALNSVVISGDPHMTAWTTAGDLRNLLLVSGNDVMISGNPTIGHSYYGAIFAHQQLKLNGNPGISGYLIAEDAEGEALRTWPGDPAPDDDDLHNDSVFDEVSGNPQIVYNPLDTAGHPFSFKLLSWRALP